MPELTPDQKEQLKMARRSNMRIEETWSLYNLFLSQDKRPQEALELAIEAVGVWADWMDHNEVEPPEIHQPDFAEAMGQYMEKAVSAFKTNPPIAMFLPQMVAGEHGTQPGPQGAQDVDAEFEAPSQTKGEGI